MPSRLHTFLSIFWGSLQGFFVSGFTNTYGPTIVAGMERIASTARAESGMVRPWSPLVSSAVSRMAFPGRSSWSRLSTRSSSFRIPVSR